MIQIGLLRRRAERRNAEEARYARRLALHANARPLGDDRTGKSIVRWVLGTMVVAIGWAAVTPVAETVTGEGRILPIGGARPAQTLDGGLVAEVLATDGAPVAAGQTLVVFDRAEEVLSLRRLEVRFEGLSAERARARAVAEGTAFLAPDTDAAREQARAHAADLALDAAVVTRLEAASEAAKMQIAFSETRVTALEEEYALAQTVEARAVGLLEKGAVSARSAEESTRLRLRVAKDLAEAESQMAKARVDAADAALALTRHMSERRVRAAEKAAELAAEIAELDEEIARMRERVLRDRVVAPVSGSIQELIVRDVGQTVAAGGTVARIVPERGELFAEVRVSADRVGHVTEGMSASVKVLAYDSARFGKIPAEVVAVSPSSDVDDHGRVYFRVRLRMSAEESSPIEVRPGLSVIADMETGQKTVLEYFAKPLRVLRDRALTEA